MVPKGLSAVSEVVAAKNAKQWDVAIEHIRALGAQARMFVGASVGNAAIADLVEAKRFDEAADIIDKLRRLKAISGDVQRQLSGTIDARRPREPERIDPLTADELRPDAPWLLALKKLDVQTAEAGINPMPVGAERAAAELHLNAVRTFLRLHHEASVSGDATALSAWLQQLKQDTYQLHLDVRVAMFNESENLSSPEPQSASAEKPDLEAIINTVVMTLNDRGKAFLNTLNAQRNTVVPYATLARAMWGDQPPADAGKNLRPIASIAGSALRKANAEATIDVQQGIGYRFTTDMPIPASEWEKLAWMPQAVVRELYAQRGREVTTARLAELTGQTPDNVRDVVFRARKVVPAIRTIRRTPELAHYIIDTEAAV